MISIVSLMINAVTMMINAMRVIILHMFNYCTFEMIMYSHGLGVCDELVIYITTMVLVILVINNTMMIAVFSWTGLRILPCLCQIGIFYWPYKSGIFYWPY